MRRFIELLFTMLVGIAPFALFAQGGPLLPRNYEPVRVPSRNLSIGCHKTTMLVFPASIQSADRGAGYVLAERVKGSENALKVKAGRPGFEPSSLTVITADGLVYVFSVSYAVDPPYLVMDFRDSLSARASVRFKGQSLNSAEMAESALWVKGSSAFMKGVHTDRYGVDFRLEGIYMHKDVMFLKFRLHNESNISYQFTSIDFFIRDLKKAKRTALQDNELRALYQRCWGLPEEADGQVIVVALPRFTIADDKKLTIKLMEKQGDRAISLDLKERKFRKAKRLYHQ